MGREFDESDIDDYQFGSLDGIPSIFISKKK